MELSNARTRFSFGNLDEVLPMSDLLAVQRESFQRFLDRDLAQAFSEISPIEDFTGQLCLELEFDANDPELHPGPKFSVTECKEKDITYAAPIFVRARFMNSATREIKEQVVFMGDFPLMTDKGTFIINGTERVVVSQLVRSPGILFQPGKDAKTVVTGTIHPYRGDWLEFDVELKPGKEVSIGARLARKRRLSLLVFFKALGCDDDVLFSKLPKAFKFLSDQAKREKEQNLTREDALLEVYKRVKPNEPPNPEMTKIYLENVFFNPKRYDLTKVGRYKLNRKLGPEIKRASELLDMELALPKEDQTVLSFAEILATATYMLHLANGEPGYHLDDQDHFANRRIRPVGELIYNQLRVGLSRMERVVRERMTTQDTEAITPQSLINIRPVVACIREFFGTSQLSQFLDQNNPLSALTHKRRLSALGPGGLTRERAGFEVRDVHSSHYGRMCPIETPEGPNIGLIGALATYAKINEYGFIETPYRKVKNGVVSDEVVYLAADEEEEYVIAQANADLDKSGHFRSDKVLVRRGPKGAEIQVGTSAIAYGSTSEIDYVSPEEVDLMDVSPKQIFSISTSLIPFVEHDDANRALMGANMQKQAVPLMIPEAPFVGTGIESRIARDGGELIIAEGTGEVIEVAADHITVAYNRTDKDSFGSLLGTKTYPLVKFSRSNQNTCINQKAIVTQGQTVTKDTILADGPGIDTGELALGKNLLVAFMTWEGYNFEDAIIISERLVRDDTLTSIHIEEYQIDARDTKLGSEEITRDIPNVPEEVLANLDERGIIRIGAEVSPGDVLVGKVTPKGETEQTPEERLLRAIFGEKAREVRDTSLKVPHGEGGVVIGVKVFSRENENELSPGVNELVRVYVAQKRKISEGDKLAGRHGNKGVISKILPIEDMPYLVDGTPVDIILNPLGVPSRMNVGQVLESHLGYAAKWGWDGNFGSMNGAVGKTAPYLSPAVWVNTPVFDGAHWDEEDKAGKHDTIKNIFQKLNPDFAGEVNGGERIITPSGKAKLYNGRTGEPYDNLISVGYIYIMKLAHMVDDKIHARSTGPYSMITQQPLGGKAQFGGQRFGEMEVWALEAYGAAYCLQELLTVKSDDILGRVKVYEAIVKGHNIPEPGIPESFKVLIKEMQALCLNVEVLSNSGEEIEMREFDDEVYKTTHDLGIDISRPERGSDEEDRRWITQGGSWNV
ncbi:MAG: DNA-directed RNA polymerase subunit beta [Actinobacteria bacterium]|nr:DNA-directed RNA polymerase subunit beta [Actinomycetota bacterium]MCL6104046.1 DNA-directed RNA polymerase subunit beta [Actinomycetota bacterium]